jgi:ABC-type nitrate/sulfonate/bicarbonate transport system permease component
MSPPPPAGAERPERHPVRDRSGLLRVRRHPVLGMAGMAALLLAWEALARSGLVSPLFLPAPSACALEAWRLTVSGALLRHTLTSLQRILAGYALGAVTGIVVGVGTGFFGRVRALGIPLINATYPIPKIAILPLMILWLGIGEAPKVAVIAIGVFFPMAINTHAGIAECDPSLLRVGISFGASRWTLVRSVLLPAALPMIFAGLRLSAGISLLLVVSAELIAADSGLGFFILNAADLLQTQDLMVGLVVLSLLGLLFNALISLAERAVVRWR